MPSDLRILVASSFLAVALGACGSNSSSNPTGETQRDSGTHDAFSIPNLNGNKLTSLTIDPKTASIESLNGAKATQAFKVTASYSDGTTVPISAAGVTWQATALGVGSIDGAGVFTATGALGGVVNITASAKGQAVTASLTVKLHLVQNPASLTGSLETTLEGATKADPSVVWSYPYDGTAWPRDLEPPTLMWNGGGATDVYYVRLESATFELEEFSTAPPPAQLAPDPTTWNTFTDSTTGSTSFHVARYDGTTATVIADQTWTIAPSSTRGTIYYWANNLGRIMRIAPGATIADDFSAGIVPSPGNGCTMACHTVSADGSTLIATGGTFGGSYDLKMNAPRYALGGTPDSGQIRQWALSAVTPDGKYVVADGLAPQLTLASGEAIDVQGMYDATSGGAIPNTTSGLGSELYYMPAFAPDGSSFVFVGDSDPNTGYWASTATAGPLKIFDFNEAKTPMLTNERLLIEPGSDTTKSVIGYPSVSPDGQWVIYQRMSWEDPSTYYNLTSFQPPDNPIATTSDLYLASTKTPGVEIRLANLDGDGYPFAAGARDLHLNFEPTFAPVAAGGYFWVVFLSRRTYGDILTGAPGTEKQLWVAAIDQNPTPGHDPSHAAFHLPGQDVTSLNLRGFWALNPCLNDGQGCTTGTDCCTGYCNPGSGEAGAAVCSSSSSGCAILGNRCTTTADCCDGASGVTCINKVCSEPTPK
jgi:WD40-like Beta Propeller Repeat